MSKSIPQLTRFPSGVLLCFAGGALLTVHAQGMRCEKAGKAIQGHPYRTGLAGLFPRAKVQLHGLVAWSEKPVEIHLGEEVGVQSPVQVNYDPGSNNCWLTK